MTQHKRTLEERFWQYVRKTDTCWLWTASTRQFGYGVINLGGRNGKIERAHRVSWELHFGPIPQNMCVLHKCDNPACVNPAHLFLGTRADNNRDMRQKGRASGGSPAGDSHHQRKLTDTQRDEICAKYAKDTPFLRVLAAEYGVSLQTIWRITHFHLSN